MPCEEKQYNVYTITHEYGHLLEAKISRGRTDWDGLHEVARKRAGAGAPEHRVLSQFVNVRREEEKKQARNIREEIIDIAKKNNKDFDLKKSLSRYGHTNDYEFFAEVFANSQCGKPNELGKAMQEWLAKEGY